MSAEQTAPASSLMVAKRYECEKSCKVSGGLGHGYDIQTNIPSAVTEGANPPGIRDCPTAFTRIRPQASDDVAVGSRLRAEIDKGECVGSVISLRVPSSTSK